MSCKLLYTKIERKVEQRCIYSPDLFNFYSEMILRGIGNLSVFIIGRYNYNSTCYVVEDIVLIANSEEKLKELLDKFKKKNERHYC